MASFSGLERYLWTASVVLSGILILRLIRQGLQRTYIWFFTYLAADVVRSCALAPFLSRLNVYAWIYLVTQPVLWLFYVLIVLELYSLVLRNHAGIATLSRWTLMGGLGLSLGISLLTLLPDLQRPTGPYPVLIYYTIIERGVISSLVVFLLLMLLFLVWYPIPLSRNILLHSVVFCVYFLSSTLALFVGNVAGFALTRTISMVLLGLTNLCLVAWIFLLTRAGESRTVVIGHQWRPEDEERLVEQLDAINTVLLRAARK